MEDEAGGAAEGFGEQPDQLGSELDRLERKYAITPDELAGPGLDEPDYDDWDDDEDEDDDEPSYSGPLNASAVTLLAQEDAVKDAELARDRRGRFKDQRPLVQTWIYYEESPRSAIGSRIAQAQDENWGDALWNPYSRAYDAHLAAMDVESRTESDVEAGGMTAIYLVDLRYWELNPKARAADYSDRRWRHRSRWARIKRRFY